MTRHQALDAMLATQGKFFKVEFVKISTGELREMVCRIGVISHLKGEPVRDYDGTPTVTLYDQAKDLVLVWDIQKREYRSFKLGRVVRLMTDGQWQTVED